MRHKTLRFKPALFKCGCFPQYDGHEYYIKAEIRGYIRLLKGVEDWGGLLSLSKLVSRLDIVICISCTLIAIQLHKYWTPASDRFDFCKIGTIGTTAFQRNHTYRSSGSFVGEMLFEGQSPAMPQSTSGSPLGLDGHAQHLQRLACTFLIAFLMRFTPHMSVNGLTSWKGRATAAIHRDGECHRNFRFSLEVFASNCLSRCASQRNTHQSACPVRP